MRSPRTIVVSLALALALGGCSLYAKKTTTPTPTGALKGVHTTITALASDSSAGDASTICSSVLSTALEQKLNKEGSCTTIITNQLATASNTTLTIEKYGGSGNTAEAVVQALDNGKNHLYTVHLVKQTKGGWRISGLSG
jgi:hypothetical protein